MTEEIRDTTAAEPAGDVAQDPSFVFVSYARADGAVVERLLVDLAVRGVTCWVDRHGLRPGTPDWEQKLRDAIRACRAVLLVASPDSRQSRYVKAELGLAELYRRTIYPLWVAGEQWLESVPFSMSTAQYLDARGEYYGRALAELVAELHDTSVPPILHLPDDTDLPSPRNPYKGLRTFGEADTQDFFGRSAATADLVDALGATLLHTDDYTARLLTVVGPSGSGKSSLVLAGLLPQLRSDALPGSSAWTYVESFVPGSRPLEALTIALAGRLERSMRVITEDLTMDSGRGLHLLAGRLAASTGDHVVLLVDQAEELFTLTSDEDERRLFLELLTAAVCEPRGPLIVCLTVRADFYHQFLRYPEFWRLLQGRTQYVAPMSTEELREAITAPAAEDGVRLRFEGDLVGDLLFEVRGQEAALPLLQFTLDQLVERREGRTLTQAAYQALGGVRGALAAHAEATYLGLPSSEHRLLAQGLLLRLAEPGVMEGEATRRRVAQEELVLQDPRRTARLQEVASTLVAARLLIAGEVSGIRTLEVGHEALLRAWPRLQGWLQDDRAGLLVHRRLTEAAREWEVGEHEEGLLYRGARLAAAQEWLARAESPALNASETAFLEASEGLRARESQEAAERGERDLAAARALAQSERRRARIARTLSAVLSLVLVAALVAAGLAVQQSRDAQAQRHQAEAQRQQAQAARGRALAERNAALQADAALRAQEQVTRGAQSQALTTAALERLHDNPELSVLLASAAVRLAPSNKAVGALTQALGATDPLRATLTGHTAPVLAVAFSPDGRRLVTAGGDATARIWDTGDDRLLAMLRGHTDTINAVAFSPDGSLIATASDDATVRLWRAQGGRPVAVLQVHTAAVTALAFSADGRVLLTAGVDGAARLWEVATGRLLRTIHHGGAADVAALLPSGTLIATGGEHDTAQLWDLRSGRVTTLPMGGAGWVGALAFDRAGDRLLTVTYQGGAAIWAVPSGRLLVRLTATVGSLAGAFSPDGRRVVTADRDGAARIFDAANGRLLATLDGGTTALRQASFTADGAGVLTLSDDGTARLWDARNGQPLLIYAHQGTAVEAAALSPRGDLVATGSDDGTVRVWATQSAVQTLRDPDSAVGWAWFDAAMPPKVITFPVDDPLIRIWDSPSGVLASTIRLPGPPLMVDVTDDGRLIGIVEREGSVSIWRTDTGKKGLPRLRYTISVGSSGLIFSHDGALMLSDSNDSPAEILRTSTGNIVSGLSVSGGWSSQLFSPDDRSIALVTNQGMLGLWDVRTGILQRTLLTGDSSGAYPSMLAFSPDNSLLAAVSANPAYAPGVARIRQTHTGRLVATLRGHADGINWVAFSPDGTLLVTASVDHTAKVWNVRTGRLVTTLSGPSAAVNMALFSPDGAWVAGASADRTVRVWNARTGAQVEVYSGFGDDVNSIAWSRVGDAILAASQDHTTRILSYPLPLLTPQLLALAQLRVGRALTAVERATYLYGAPDG